MLKEQDCFYPIEGDASSVVNHFKKEFKNINFLNYLPDYHVQKLYLFDEETRNTIIKNNKTLSKINKVLEISDCLFIEISKNSWVNWHIDTPRKGPAINLLLTPKARSHSLFVPSLYNSTNIIECKYPLYQFVLYNTDHLHSVLNFDKPRYIFHAYFKKGKTDLSWDEVKKTLGSIKLLK